mgnify:CR=1 FL=1
MITSQKPSERIAQQFSALKARAELAERLLDDSIIEKCQLLAQLEAMT